MKTTTKKVREDQHIVSIVPPPHPGALLRDGILADLEPRLTQQEIANLLGVSRQTVANLLAEDRSVSPEMAHRLARAFGSTPELWMKLQSDYDLWKVEQDEKTWSGIQRISRLRAA